MMKKMRWTVLAARLPRAAIALTGTPYVRCVHPTNPFRLALGIAGAGLRRPNRAPAEQCWQSTAAFGNSHIFVLDIVAASRPSPKPSRIKVRDQLAHLHAQGLRPNRIGVPDGRSAAFKSEAHCQSAAIAASAHIMQDQAFIEAISDRGDEEGALHARA
jgi:hypothetical protein